ncbi:ANTAR domain-containing protein [Williamsia sp.]|uniref:ANTAR domain-containing protein n=1 Tax=Williamsia sp. TaxID=1872085 RepID=UPI002F947125
MSTTDKASSDARIHVVLAELARNLHSKAHLGPNAVLADITASALEVIDGVHSAGITLTKGRKVIQTLAPTDDIARRFDELQHQTTQGPGLDAAWQHRTVRVPDLLTDDRWPLFTAALREQSPVRSSVSYALFPNSGGTGALNVCSTQPFSITDDAVEAGYALAAHAALILEVARKEEQFQSALASRDVIGQAKGMLMERFNVDAEQAFILLTKLSHESNVTVVEICRQLTSAKPETD